MTRHILYLEGVSRIRTQEDQMKESPSAGPGSSFAGPHACRECESLRRLFFSICVNSHVNEELRN